MLPLLVSSALASVLIVDSVIGRDPFFTMFLILLFTNYVLTLHLEYLLYIPFHYVVFHLAVYY